MEIRPIRTEADYEAALAEIERLFDAAPNTPESDRLDVLTTLVEAMRCTIIPSRSQTRSRRSSTTWKVGGYRELTWSHTSAAARRVAEVLNRKRALSLNMIRRLYAGLGIPAEVLVRPYAVAEDKATYRTS